MPTFLVFLLAYTLSQFYRSFLAVIAPELGAALGLDAADLGNMSAVWFWAFALSQFHVGWALDRLGPRRTVPAHLAVAVVGAVLLAAAQGLGMALLAMALIGVGCSPVYMGALYTFGRVHAPDRFATMAGFLLGIGSAGNLLGATPLAAAAEFLGWRASLMLIAGLTALAGLLLVLVVRDPPMAERPAGSSGNAWAELKAILGMRVLWPLLPVTLVSYAVLLAERGLWVGPYLAEVFALDPVPRGNVVLLMAAAMSVGALIYGPLDRHLGRHRPIVIVGGLVTGALFLLLASLPDVTVAQATLLLAAIGACGMTYTSLLAHARAYFPPHLLGRGITTMNFVFFAGAGLLQPISGALVTRLKDSGLAPEAVYAILHGVFGILLVCSTLIYLASREPVRAGRQAAA